jgi:hypothetical protein
VQARISLDAVSPRTGSCEGYEGRRGWQGQDDLPIVDSYHWIVKSISRGVLLQLHLNRLRKAETLTN